MGIGGHAAARGNAATSRPKPAAGAATRPDVGRKRAAPSRRSDAPAASDSTDTATFRA